jgi:hypothetical protein
MTDDSPERALDTDDSVENYSKVIQTNREGHSNFAGDVSSSTEVKTPRREVRWKLDKSVNNRSLESIVRRFEDYLDCVSASSADSPLRRITASPHKLVSHRCPGYLRSRDMRVLLLLTNTPVKARFAQYVVSLFDILASHCNIILLSVSDSAHRKEISRHHPSGVIRLNRLLRRVGLFMTVS